MAESTMETSGTLLFPTERSSVITKLLKIVMVLPARIVPKYTRVSVIISSGVCRKINSRRIRSRLNVVITIPMARQI